MRFKSIRIPRSTYEGTKQAQNILKAARKVFIRNGAAAFSTRRVAKEAKLGLGSVQHVFPTTDSLLTAMFEDLVTSYDVAYQERMAKLPFNGEARLSAALDYLLNDICNPETRHMFFGFWALSCHNRLVETLMQQAYTHHQNNVATFIGAVRADLTDDECRMLATQVIALIDGSMIFTAPKTKLIPRAEFMRALKSTIWSMISGPSAPRSELPMRPKASAGAESWSRASATSQATASPRSGAE
jgi:AcrR family transcriptional regulator